VIVCVCPIALQAGSVDDLRSFRTRRQPTRRSARSGTIKGPIDPKGMVSNIWRYFLLLKKFTIKFFAFQTVFTASNHGLPFLFFPEQCDSPSTEHPRNNNSSSNNNNNSSCLNLCSSRCLNKNQIRYFLAASGWSRTLVERCCMPSRPVSRWPGCRVQARQRSSCNSSSTAVSAVFNRIVSAVFVNFHYVVFALLWISRFVVSSVWRERISDIGRFWRRQVPGIARGRLPLLPSRQQQHVPDTWICTLACSPTVPSTPAEHVPTTCADRTQPPGKKIKQIIQPKSNRFVEGCFSRFKVG